MPDGPIQPIGDPGAREAIQRIEAKLTEIEGRLEEIEDKFEKTDAAIVDIYGKLPML